MCVSESVSHCVFRKLGFTMADPFAVSVGADFAEQLTKQFQFEPPVAPGRHWGTRRFQKDAYASTLSPDTISMLNDPQRVFTLYLGDVILAHRDRSTEGNVLLITSSGPGMDLIPIDQSDCFCGTDTLRDPEALAQLGNRQVHDTPDGMEGIILAEDDFIVEEFNRVKGLKEELLECVTTPFDEWYDRAEIDPDALRDVLGKRIDDLWALARMDHWNGIRGAVGGGCVLDFE